MRRSSPTLPRSRWVAHSAFKWGQGPGRYRSSGTQDRETDRAARQPLPLQRQRLTREDRAQKLHRRNAPTPCLTACLELERMQYLIEQYHPRQDRGAGEMSVESRMSRGDR